MTLKIEICLENSAFEGCEGSEAARILSKLALRIYDEKMTLGDVTPCIDLNGNKVGQAEVVE